MLTNRFWIICTTTIVLLFHSIHLSSSVSFTKPLGLKPLFQYNPTVPFQTANTLRITSCSSDILQNDDKVPQCKIIFREEGSWTPLPMRNITCIKHHNQIFVVSFGRGQVPDDFQATNDRQHFDALYEATPPYARITCSAKYPFEFDYIGGGYLTFFRIWKGIKPQNKNTNSSLGSIKELLYEVNAEVLLSPESTGAYVFWKRDEPTVNTTFSIISERPNPPYIFRGTEKVEILEQSNEIRIPCMMTNPWTVKIRLEVQLDPNNKTSRSNIGNITTFKYDPELGFLVPKSDLTMNPNNNLSLYFCIEESSENTTLEFQYPSKININKTEVMESYLSLHIDPTSGASCYNFRDNEILRLTNVYIRNPSEAKLMIQCLRTGNRYCGSHSYHERKDDEVTKSSMINFGYLEKPTAAACPNNSTICANILRIHPEGVIACTEIDFKGNVIDMQAIEYYTGLNGKIYTAQIFLNETSALIGPKFNPNGTKNDDGILEFWTGIKYEINCWSSGNLIKDPQILFVKFKNETIQELPQVSWWHSSSKLYSLTTEMIEIGCKDWKWSMDEQVNASVKISVKNKECGPEDFKCKSGECIPNQMEDCPPYYFNPGDYDELMKGQELKFGYEGIIEFEDIEQSQIHCSNQSLICNNRNDCDDGSDEDLEICKNNKCKEGTEFQCAKGKQCIPIHKLCDAFRDCLDESDESSESCAGSLPKFINMKPNVTWYEGMNKYEELVCEVDMTNYSKLSVSLEWAHNNEKVINDVWKSARPYINNKVALRLYNISQETHRGIYTCTASGAGTANYTVLVNILKKSEYSYLMCDKNLIETECQHRGCSYDLTSSSCHIPDNKLSTASSELRGHTSQSEEVYKILAFISLIALSILILGLAGMKWQQRKQFTSDSTARLHDGDQVILDGI